MRRAFTLIELLVVIAVIAILIGVLLPALGQARRSGRTTACLSNMKNLVAGWTMYADANKGALVGHRAPNLGGGFANAEHWHEVGNGLKFRPTWISRMGQFVGVYGFATPRTDSDRQDFESKVYLCPEAAERTDERNAAYGYNYQFLGNTRRDFGFWHNWPVSMSRILAPERTLIAGDSMGTAAGYPADQRLPYENDGRTEAAVGNEAFIIDPPRLNPQGDIAGNGHNSAVDPRHSGAVAAMYADGHAAVAKPNALGYRIRGDGLFLTAGPGNQPGGPAEGDAPRNDLFSGTGADDLPPAIPR